jgi:hypothetical protein
MVVIDGWGEADVRGPPELIEATDNIVPASKASATQVAISGKAVG